ncbi:RHS repeat domain-containing protein, partial [Pseudomonas rustica]
LCNDAGSQRSFWDERGSQCHREFDELQRPVALTEQAFGEQPQVVERWTYADATESFAQHNQCGQLIRHDDPGGGQLLGDYGLSGAVLEESRRFLIELDAPDWPRLLDARDKLLEEKAYVTRYAFYPTGEVQRQIDAARNTQIFHFNVAGKSSATWLLQSGEGQHPQCLVSEIRYNAQDQIESETAGNGVVSSADYSPEDGRLLRLFAGVVGQQPLQDLNYAYDPVGNIVELEDKCQIASHFNGQRIDHVSRYRYDSLYQLVEAKGWEVSKPSHGPALPDLLPVPLDPAQRRNYTQTFTYDAAGNLITRHHSGAPGFSMFTSARSNRSLAQLDNGSLPGEAQISLGFDAAGNQLELQRGQAMAWNVRNELSRVTLVRRGAEADDCESYVYDRPGHRLRKTQISRASGQTLTTEVRYLPGLEIHCEVDGVERHVVSVDAGRNHVRLLHWPASAESDQWRYSLGDHLGSSSMELDESAGILSQEYFYAFGGTACWAGKSALTAKYKTIRYSGKERDATGLYYYGYRYYAPWLQRWVNTDPAGVIDGLNVFRALRNSPISLRENSGLLPVLPEKALTSEQVALEDVSREISNNFPDTHSDSVGEDNVEYRGETFLDRVSEYFQKNIARITHLNEVLDHQKLSSIMISSSRMILPAGGGVVAKDEFINEYYSSGKWVFRGNYKESKTEKFFASDVQLVQAAIMGVTKYPSVIVRNEVKNKDTLAATRDFASGSDELKDAFFTTPNGKNTARILMALDMEAVSIERTFVAHAEFPSFYIAVRNKSRVAMNRNVN